MMRTEKINNIHGNFQTAVSEHSGLLTGLATFAIAAQIFSLASAWLLPAVSEFTLLGDNISETVLGSFGFVQTAAFILTGLGTLALAYVLRQTTISSWGTFIGLLLIAVNGVSLIVVAFFPTDRIDIPADVWTQSATGMVHITAALISFVCVIVGMVIMTWKFRKEARWRSLIIWFALLSTSSVSLFFAQGEGPRVGLMQRLLVTAITGWMIPAAFRARSIGASAKEEN
jgi:hypothetical protein